MQTVDPVETVFLATLSIKEYINKLKWIIVLGYKPPKIKDAQFERRCDRFLHTASIEYQNILPLGDLNCDMLHRDINVCQWEMSVIFLHTFTSKNGTSLLGVFPTKQKGKFL